MPDHGKDEYWKNRSGMTIQPTTMTKKTEKIEYHTNCRDCGHFVKKSERVAKDNPHKHHSLCGECLSNYDCVECDNTM